MIGIGILLAMTPGMITLFGVWMLVCNSRTYRQRMHLIHYFPSLRKPDWFWGELSAVEYSDHMWSLARFGNPQRLYGPGIRAIWSHAIR